MKYENCYTVIRKDQTGYEAVRFMTHDLTEAYNFQIEMQNLNPAHTYTVVNRGEEF